MGTRPSSQGADIIEGARAKSSHTNAKKTLLYIRFDRVIPTRESKDLTDSGGPTADTFAENVARDRDRFARRALYRARPARSENALIRRRFQKYPDIDALPRRIACHLSFSRMCLRHHRGCISAAIEHTISQIVSHRSGSGLTGVMSRIFHCLAGQSLD